MYLLSLPKNHRSPLTDHYLLVRIFDLVLCVMSCYIIAVSKKNSGHHVVIT